MTELLAICLLWIINACVNAGLIMYVFHIKRKHPTRVDVSPWIIAIGVWEFIFTVLCVSTFIAYLN